MYLHWDESQSLRDDLFIFKKANFTSKAVPLLRPQGNDNQQAGHLDDVDLFEDWGVARPYDRIADGQVALTAWGRVHTMTGVNPGEIELFFEAFAGSLGPERFTC